MGTTENEWNDYRGARCCEEIICDDGTGDCIGEYCCTRYSDPSSTYCCDAETKVGCCGDFCLPMGRRCCEDWCEGYARHHTCDAEKEQCCYFGCYGDCGDPPTGVPFCCNSGYGNICMGCDEIHYCSYQCCCAHNMVDCGWDDGTMCCDDCCSDTSGTNPCPTGSCPGDTSFRGDVDDEYGWYDIHGECLFVYCPEPCSWDSCDDPNIPSQPAIKPGWNWYWWRERCVHMSDEEGQFKNLILCGDKYGFDRDCKLPNCIPFNAE